jgi:hypothetical protein
VLLPRFESGFILASADADGGTTIGGGLGDQAWGFAFGAARGGRLGDGGGGGGEGVLGFGCWFSR